MPRFSKYCRFSSLVVFYNRRISLNISDYTYLFIHSWYSSRQTSIIYYLLYFWTKHVTGKSVRLVTVSFLPPFNPFVPGNFGDFAKTRLRNLAKPLSGHYQTKTNQNAVYKSSTSQLSVVMLKFVHNNKIA